MKQKVAVILMGLRSSDVGGAERRISSLTHYLPKVGSNKETFLIINQELLDLLISINLPPAGNPIALKSWLTKSRELSHTNIFLKRIGGRILSLISHLFLCLQLGFVLIRLRPDLVQLVSISTLRVFFPFLHLLATTKIISLVGSETRDYKFQNPFDRWLLRQYLNKVELIDVLSEELCELLIAQELAAIDKIRINGSFVDVQKYSTLPDKKPWVVFVGRLIEEKNPLLFIEAIPHIRRKCNDPVRFFLLGSGPLERKINERVIELGVQSCVNIQFAPNIDDILSNSMVFCSLQRRENYPSRSLLEAMACANALVATDVGYTYKLVNEDTGIRVPPDACAVADAIVNLINNPTVALELGRNARSLVMSAYSPASYAGRIMDMYEEAITRRKKARTKNMMLRK